MDSGTDCLEVCFNTVIFAALVFLGLKCTFKSDTIALRHKKIPDRGSMRFTSGKNACSVSHTSGSVETCVAAKRGCAFFGV